MNSLPDSEIKRYLTQLPLSSEVGPRLTNRGVISPDTPIVFSHLDYLSVRWDAPLKHGASGFVVPFLGHDFALKHEASGIKNYRYGATLEPAGRYYWNSESHRLPGYLVFAGKDLAILREDKAIDDAGILAMLMPRAHGVTRLDFATNINAGHPDETLTEWKAGHVETRVQTADRIDRHGKNAGYTMYYGSPQSERFIRCYDKAAEQKMAGVTLTRIEQQIGKQPAHRLATEMMIGGVKEVGKASIRKFINFPRLQWWRDAVEGPDYDLQLKPERSTSFERWLNEQVYSAIEKRHNAGMETEVIEAFIKRLMLLYGELPAAD